MSEDNQEDEEKAKSPVLKIILIVAGILLLIAINLPMIRRHSSLLYKGLLLQYLFFPLQHSQLIYLDTS